MPCISEVGYYPDFSHIYLLEQYILMACARQAWKKLGTMPPEDAMLKFIEIVTELYPSWAAGSTTKRKGAHDSDPPSTDTRPMGPVFSTFVYEEESGNELKLDAVHAFAREGDTGNLLKFVESGVAVDLKDSEGRTPLHWAVDRGHLDVAELLLSNNADVNSKDNEGQTPLHYAAVCAREAIAELLVKRNAATDIKDGDGNFPRDLCDLNWRWIQPRFLHPEDSKNEQIQNWLLRKKIRQMDYDKDQKISLLEFKNGAYDTYKNYIEFEIVGTNAASPEDLFAELDANKNRLMRTMTEI